MAIEIPTPWGSVTESARLQAAINIRDVPGKYEEVLAILAKQLGSVAKAEVELRRRYPEAFQEGE